MKSKLQTIVAKLDAEAKHFKALAKEAALDCLMKQGQHEEFARRAREHLIRAETFKTAANLVRGGKVAA